MVAVRSKWNEQASEISSRGAKNFVEQSTPLSPALPQLICSFCPSRCLEDIRAMRLVEINDCLQRADVFFVSRFRFFSTFFVPLGLLTSRCSFDLFLLNTFSLSGPGSNKNNSSSSSPTKEEETSTSSSTTTTPADSPAPPRRPHPRRRRRHRSWTKGRHRRSTRRGRSGRG